MNLFDSSYSYSIKIAAPKKTLINNYSVTVDQVQVILVTGV